MKSKILNCLILIKRDEYFFSSEPIIRCSETPIILNAVHNAPAGFPLAFLTKWLLFSPGANENNLTFYLKPQGYHIGDYDFAIDLNSYVRNIYSIN